MQQQQQQPMSAFCQPVATFEQFNLGGGVVYPLHGGRTPRQRCSLAELVSGGSAATKDFRLKAAAATARLSQFQQLRRSVHVFGGHCGGGSGGGRASEFVAFETRLRSSPIAASDGKPSLSDVGSSSASTSSLSVFSIDSILSSKTQTNRHLYHPKQQIGEENEEQEQEEEDRRRRECSARLFHRQHSDSASAAAGLAYYAYQSSCMAAAAGTVPLFVQPSELSVGESSTSPAPFPHLFC